MACWKSGSGGVATRRNHRVAWRLLSALLTTLAFASLAAGARAAPVSIHRLGWSGRLLANGLGGNQILAGGLACPSVTQCTATEIQGEEATFNPRDPEIVNGVPIDEASPKGIACPSSTLCVSVDNRGQRTTFDPLAPTPASTQRVGTDSLGDVACPNAGECVAVGNPTSNEVVFEPTGSGLSGKEAPILQFDPENGLASVTCPTASQCSAVDLLGNVVTFNPLTLALTELSTVDGLAETLAIACPSASECTLVDVAGDELTFDPVAPRDPKPVPIAPADFLWRVACPSSAECVALGETGVVVFDPAEPQAKPVTIPLGFSAFAGSIACPAEDQCTAVGGSMEATFDPESPPEPEHREPPQEAGCASEASCSASGSARWVPCIGDRSPLAVSLTGVPVVRSHGQRLTLAGGSYSVDGGRTYRFGSHPHLRTAKAASGIVRPAREASAVSRGVQVGLLSTTLRPGPHQVKLRLDFSGGHPRAHATRKLALPFSVCPASGAG
jgi:hypothetical protein